MVMVCRQPLIQSLSFAMTISIETSLNYNCDKVESMEGGLRRDGVENKDLLDRDGEREGEGEGHCCVLLCNPMSDLDF